MTQQTKLISLIESCSNTGVGFIISLAVWYGILWTEWFDINVSHTDNFIITFIFTVTNIIRGYALRRAFNNFHTYLHEVII